MQATLDVTGLKHLTRALQCLSKFGDEVVITATIDTFAISATNNAQSAYGRFKYPRSFFSKYRVDALQADDGDTSVSGQIGAKPLLAILKHKANEKACEKCELVVTDGPSQNAHFDGEDDEEWDTLESRLTVRLHCKHGVVKTHRLPLNPANNLSPSMLNPAFESRLTVGPKALKSLLEHFPFGKGSKADPQLIWNFSDDDVQLRSLESAIDTKGRPQLVTELTISAEEFDHYDLQTGPMTIGFHLREFNATIAFAEASQTALEIRFSDPAEPIVISVDSELSETLFVIASSHLQSFSQRGSQRSQRDDNARDNGGAPAKGKKRPLEDDSNQRHPRVVDRQKRPMKVVHVADRASVAREMRPAPAPPQEPQPSWAILTAAQRPYQHQGDDREYDYTDDQVQYESAGPSQPEVGRAFGGDITTGKGKGRAKDVEPLFLPSSQLSQLPPAAEAAIIDSGLGIEHMTAEELEAMLEGDAEEVEFTQGKARSEEEEDELRGDDDWHMGDGIDFGQGGRSGSDEKGDSFELVDDVEMGPTQHDEGSKVFRPLFDD